MICAGAFSFNSIWYFYRYQFGSDRCHLPATLPSGWRIMAFVWQRVRRHGSMAISKLAGSLRGLEWLAEALRDDYLIIFFRGAYRISLDL